jgi:hypothetical protein
MYFGKRVNCSRPCMLVRPHSLSFYLCSKVKQNVVSLHQETRQNNSDLIDKNPKV